MAAGHWPPSQQVHPLAAVLGDITPQCCPTRVNFHCHTLCSDGSLRPADLAQQALTLGLEHLAITDHHSLAAYDGAHAVLERARDRHEPAPILWRGVEISALLEGCLVHVLALGFDAHHPSLTPYLQGNSQVGAALRADVVVAAIHEAGGLALLAHPGRYRLPFNTLIRAAATLGFDGAETWYDYDMAPIWSPTPLLCEAIAAEVRRCGLLMSCGTDSHGYDLGGR
jgi:hypothetical protein